MKNIVLLVFLSTLGLSAQNTDYTKNVTTLDSTLATLYSVVSGEQGKERNWELFKHLFRKDAKLIPTGRMDDKSTVRYLTPDDYINTSGKWLVENGFHQVEINRETQNFGNIAHVFSTYEAYKNKDDATPFLRGINSIQLFYDGTRWWIINMYWMQESETRAIPELYLPKH